MIMRALRALLPALAFLACLQGDATGQAIPGLAALVGHAAPLTVVALGTGNSSGASGNATITGVTVPAGAFIGVFVNENCAATSGMSVSDGGTNTYTATTLNLSGNLCYGFFTVTNAAALSGATITFNQHSTGDGAAMAAFYITGAATASAIDGAVTNTAGGTSTSPSVTSAGTAGQSGEMFLGVAWGLACGTFTQAGSWSNIDSKVCNIQANATLVGEGSQLNSGTGTLTYNPTLGTSQQWEAGIYGIKHP